MFLKRKMQCCAPGAGLLLALLGFAMVDAPREAQARMSTDAATKYFLDEPPTADDLARLPTTARDVVVAKVRISGKPHYLIEREQQGQVSPLPNDLFTARVEIIDVLKGSATVGGQHDVYFGIAGVRARYVFPHTKDRRARDYFVASYVAQDDVRRLLAVSASKENFEQWERDFFEYMRPTGSAFAGPPPTDCLSVVREIDKRLEVKKITREAARMLAALQNKAKTLHQAGWYPECLYPLLEWF